MKKLFTLLAASVLLTATAFGQGQRAFIRDHIKQYGSCKTVAITETKGNVMIYNNNGYAYDGCPKTMAEYIKVYNKQNTLIKDVQISENGSWLILYGEHGFKYSGIPKDLGTKLFDLYHKNAVFNSVDFNDGGDWLIITTKGVFTSNGKATEWFTAGLQQYGRLLSACITDDAMVAVYEHGYKWIGAVPNSLKEALNKTKLNVYRLKLAGSCWFFADKDGNCQWYM